jgi:hypothetical protein
MVARIRRRYPATVNLGRAGSGPLLMLALLREYLPGLRPKVVVWCYFSGNDLLDLRRERTHPILIRYLEDGFRQGLLERQDALDRALEAYLKAYHVPALVRRSKAWPRAVDVLALRNLRARLGLSFADPYATVPTEDEYRLFEQVLAKAKATVTAWGGRMYFVCLPGWTELPSQIGEGAQAELEPKVQQRVLALARGLGLTVIDVRSAFAAHPAPESLFACRKCHYNAEGYRVAADAILRALEPAAQP